MGWVRRPASRCERLVRGVGTSTACSLMEPTLGGSATLNLLELKREPREPKPEAGALSPVVGKPLLLLL